MKSRTAKTAALLLAGPTGGFTAGAIATALLVRHPVDTPGIVMGALVFFAAGAVGLVVAISAAAVALEHRADPRVVLAIEAAGCVAGVVTWLIFGW